MKDWGFDGILIFLVGTAVAVTLFLGVVTAIKKSFKLAPSAPRLDSSEMLRDQKRRTEETKRQYKNLMRDREQKLRDSRNRP